MRIANVGGRLTLLLADGAVDAATASDGRFGPDPQAAYEVFDELAHCTAMGPCVLTMDEVDEWSVRMTARVNGEIRATGTTKNRQFSFAEVLAWASLGEPVHPGEFFALGTVGGGCGLGLDRWIQPGDVVELEADGVGVLRNPVGARQVAPPGAGVAGYTGAPWGSARHWS